MEFSIVIFVLRCMPGSSRYVKRNIAFFGRFLLGEFRHTFHTQDRKIQNKKNSPKRLGPGLIPPQKKRENNLEDPGKTPSKMGVPLTVWRCHTSHPPDHRLGLTPDHRGRFGSAWHTELTAQALERMGRVYLYINPRRPNTLGSEVFRAPKHTFSTPNLSRYFGRLGQWLVVNG